jgi:histidyl-tRNA synthetase
VDLEVTGSSPVPGTPFFDEFMSNPIEPQTLKGFRDLLPEAMIARNAAIERIRKVYEKYGFAPIDTPALEYLRTLTGAGGEEATKLLFHLKTPEGDAAAMRFDLTVPFARLLAQYPEQLKLPFRRYHIGPVFRADDPHPGRYRQFTQFDIDAAGSASMMVEAEIVAAMAEVMKEFGVQPGEFVIQINNLRAIHAFLTQLGVPDLPTAKRVMRVIDKLRKVGLENVRRELGEGRVDASGDPIRGVGLDAVQIDEICRLLKITGAGRTAIVAALGELLQKTEMAEQALAELTELADLLDAHGVAEEEAVFDGSLMRGLDYYTAVVFEAYLPNAQQFGSILGGGRYDNLVDRFQPASIPACGVSIGLDRFLDALAHLGKITLAPTNTQVLVIGMKGVPGAELLRLAAELRQAEIRTEVYLGAPGSSMKDQLAFANAREFPLAVIVGEDEIKAGTVSIKNLVIGRKIRASAADREAYRQQGRAGQVTAPRAELITAIREQLEAARE